MGLERPIDVLSYQDPALSSRVSACRISPWRLLGPDTFDRRKTLITRGLWVAILNRRLAVLSQGADAPFSNATINLSSWPREGGAVCLNLSPPVDGDWRPALSAGLAEIRRLEAHGVNSSEIERIVGLQRRVNRLNVRQARDRFSPALAQNLLDAFPLHGFDPVGFSTPEETARVYDRAVDDIAPEDIHSDFLGMWSGSEPLISVLSSEAVSKDEVVAVWNSAAEAPSPDAQAPTQAGSAWAYSDFGPPGQIASRQLVRDPRFTRVTFDNGVILNVKSVSHTQSLVQISVEFGGGRSSLSDADHHIGAFGAGALPAAGFGAHSQREVQDLFPDRRLGFGMRMLNDTFQAYASVAPADVELHLQMISALVTDPGFRDDFVGQQRAAIDTVYRSYQTQPTLVLSLAVSEAISPGNPRLLPPRTVMDGLTMSDIERVYRPILTEAPLEVTIVGDMAEETMIRRVAETLGALPPREPVANRQRSFLLRYGEARPLIEATHEGPADQAALTAVWPLFVSDFGRRREQRAIELLRLILAERIQMEVRESLGAAYTPSVNLRFEDGGDDGALSIDVVTSPADVERVQAAISRVVAKVVEGDLRQSDLDDVRIPILARIPDERARTSWWYGVLNGSAREPHALRDALEWEGDYRTMGLEEVKRAAATWLSGEPIWGVARPRSISAPTPEAAY